MLLRKLLPPVLLLIFWAISLRHLTIVPPIYEDEPWQASTGWKIATEGVFGSDMFTGFYGMEEHYYGYMPLHPFLLAVVFRLAGLGVFQARFEPVVLGLLLLALTYRLGRQLFHPAVGLLAMVLLLLTRTSAVSPSQMSGIIFLDIPRISRYDMLAPVFGLSGLLTYWTALQAISGRRRLLLYGLAGFLCGLAGLSHLYGVFWFAALVLLALWQRSGRWPFIALCLGFLLPWLPYVLYVLQAPADWAGQTRDYAPRFGLLDPAWYWQNLVQEVRRYGPGLGAPGRHWLLRPGLWTFVLVVPLALLALGRQAWRGDRAAAVLFVPAVLLPLLFALLIYLKLANYLITLWPMFALAAAWGLWRLWRYSQRSQVGLLLRTVLVLLFLAVAAEGLARIGRMEAAAATMTPFEEYAAQVREYVPAGTRVLGMHHYWLGLADHDYRTWAVPLLQTEAYYWSPPLTLAQALDGVDPQVVLVDRRLEAYLADRPAAATALAEWLDSRGFTQAGVVEDDTYGRMTIFVVGDAP